MFFCWDWRTFQCSIEMRCQLLDFDIELRSSEALIFPSVAITIGDINLELISDPLSHLLIEGCPVPTRRASSDWDPTISIALLITAFIELVPVT